MKLSSFTIRNYRSIKEARKIYVHDYTILIGANNEGKSNILHALSLAMQELVNWKIRRDKRSTIIERFIQRRRNLISYNYDRDFPIQNKVSKKAKTSIILEFELDEAEIKEFRQEIGSSLNGTLPIEVSFERDNKSIIKLKKQGKGSKILNDKSEKITDFISDRIGFEYIPSFRNSDVAIKIIADLISRKFRTLEESEEYIKLTNKLSDLQKPILDELSQSIKETISKFLPNVKSVHIDTDDYVRLSTRDINIKIDDGIMTPIERKGDGIQSLVALALMRHISAERQKSNRNIIAIEEPESHLHPRAIHEIKNILESLSEENQVIITTHSPIFVNSINIENSIIVDNSKAQPAKNIEEIRKALGVKVSDNLFSARIAVITEGKSDADILEKYISETHKDLKKLIDAREIVFDHLDSVSKLSTKVGYYKANTVAVRCFVDDDHEARKAIEKSIELDSLNHNEIIKSTVPGKKEAEIEDMFDKNLYIEPFCNHFGVCRNSLKKQLSNNRYKWSNNVEKAFRECGKHWDKNTKNKVKKWIHDFAIQNIKSIFREELISPLNNLINELNRLK